MKIAVQYGCQTWIQYTWDFIVSILPFDLTVEQIEADRSIIDDGYDLAVGYGVRPDSQSPSVFIPRSNHSSIRSAVNGDVTYHQDERLLHAEFKDDIVRYIFERISCKLEYDCEAVNRPVRSLAARFPNCLYDFKEPTVNKLVVSLANCITELARLSGRLGTLRARPLYPDDKSFAVCLTHDIDTIDWSPKMALKQTRHTLYRSKRYLQAGNLNRLANEIRTLCRKVFEVNNDYWQIGAIERLESEHGARSTYNFYVRTSLNVKSTKGRLYDPEYDLRNHSKLLNVIDWIRQQGSEVGLHGSYDSFDNLKKLKAEKAGLEDLLQGEVSGIRQHFLQYSQHSTPIAHYSAGLQYDTTLGFRDINGFRAGCCLPFYAFDHSNQQQLDVLQIPLVIMDGVLFDREFSSYDEAWADVMQILNHVKETRGACSILWHNHVFCEETFPGWGFIYKQIMTWVGENDGWLGPVRDLNDWWRNAN